MIEERNSAPIKAALDRHRVPLRRFADALYISRSSASRLLRHNVWLIQLTAYKVINAAARAGVPESDLPSLEEVDPAAATAKSRPKSKVSSNEEGIEMMMRRQAVSQTTCRHFGLSCDPFSRELQSQADVYHCPDIVYVREAMWAVANHGGFLAVIGESGAGKTTVLDDLCDRILTEHQPVVVIRPDVVNLMQRNTGGTVMRARDLQEAVIYGLDPTAVIKRSSQARGGQVKASLLAAYEAGQKVCLVIDEAHDLPAPTLKHLKRLLEIKQGFKRLLSIILLGQTELALRLSEHAPDIREVVQRIEVVTLEPLDEALDSYLAFKLKAAGVDLADVFTRDGLDALAQRLKIGQANERSVAYPLAIHNLSGAALNTAAQIGAPIVDADVVMEVLR